MTRSTAYYRRLDNDARRRHVSLDLNRLDGLLETFYKRAIENVDAQAGLLCVKIMERKAAMLGLDSPQQLDIVQVQAQKEPTEFEQISAAINRVYMEQPQAQREALEMVHKIGGEKALEILKAGLNGNGAASSADDAEPKH